MKLARDLKSGNFATYAQWLAFISLIFMIVLPFFYIGTVGLLFVWSIMTWVMALLTLLIEFPLLARLLPESSSLSRPIQWTRNLFFRSISYLLFATCLWLSWVISWSWLIMPAILSTATAVAYALAIWRREELRSSCVFFSSSGSADNVI